MADATIVKSYDNPALQGADMYLMQDTNGLFCMMLSVDDCQTYSRHAMNSVADADEWASKKWEELMDALCPECGNKHEDCSCEDKIRVCANHDCKNKTTNKYHCADCELLQRAFDAFWNVIAAGHPEIKSGDGDFSEFETMGKGCVADWIRWNTPCTDED